MSSDTISTPVEATPLTDIPPTLLVEEHFRRILDTVTVLSKQCRVIGDEVRSLQKAYRVVEKASKQKKKRPQAEMKPSVELVKFLKLEKGKNYTRACVMKLVSEYIKAKDLQIADNKRKFRADKPLAKIFGLSAAEVKDMTFVEINKYITPQLSKLEEVTKSV
jgi:chromatin remodeling complex protein RSC6